MEPTKRIILNTAAQYTKAVVTTLLALVTTRIILDALHVDDYGIYSVVGGVVALLGFVTGALITTTQRYISYYHGVGNRRLVELYFTNSLLLHIVIGVTLAAALLAMEGVLFSHFLNIDPARQPTAQVVYVITVGMLLLTVVTAPFKALFIARENIVFVAVVDTVDAVVKLLAAIVLHYVTADKLLVYALMMGGVLVLNLFIYVGYAKARFPECRLTISRRDVAGSYLRPLAGFAGWTTFGMGATACRTQGFAVVFNHFLGTAINAAYGIALQVFGSVSVIVTSILNAMNPQIMKAEGNGDRRRMLLLALQECKYATALLAAISIPIIVEMPAILSVWLKEVPVHTAMFCRMVLVAFICDQLTMGLHSAQQATGHLSTYSLLVFTPKLLNLPVAWLMLRSGMTPTAVMAVYLAIELGVALLRLPIAHRSMGLGLRHYFSGVVRPLVPLLLLTTAAAWLLACVLPPFAFRFVATFVLSLAASAVVAWVFTLSRDERHYVVNLIPRRHAADRRP